MSADLNLRALVREVLDGTDLTQPREVAAETLARLKPEDVRSALEQILSEFVRYEMHRLRNRGEAQAATAGRSRKVQAIREAWQQKLRDRVHVGELGWKMLADCTRDDLLFAARERRVMAERNQVKAYEYERLAKLLGDMRVPCVGDLPPDALRDELGGEAA